MEYEACFATFIAKRQQVGITPELVADFRQIILERYLANPRLFPWRQTEDSYQILVSEIMLQQTQTDRVVPKYEQFLRLFPTIQRLAAAPVTDLLATWQGLGYNRRALALQRLAGLVVAQYDGQIPADEVELRKLPGIGPYTAAAVVTFAYSQRTVFVETNIRRVFIHFFFEPDHVVHDQELYPLIEQALPDGGYRDWYYALMDYGAWLAKVLPNPNRRSRHYTKQSTFEGSNRQLRGQILKVLVKKSRMTMDQLGITVAVERERLEKVVKALSLEGFLDVRDNEVELAN